MLLLAPTLVLQVGAPTYLRTRLAPSVWTVAVGAIVLVWIAQVSIPAATALVAARRAGVPARLDLRLLRLSLQIGTRVTLGLAAGVVPGFWLQARYAFAPLLDRGAGARSSALLEASAVATRHTRAPLLLIAGIALAASALGQSAIAALAEGMGTITAVGQQNGRTLFEIHMLPHTITSVAAYLWSAAVLTFQAVYVSVLFDTSRGIVPESHASRTRVRWSRAATAAAVLVVIAALAAAGYKIQQHVTGWLH